MCAATVDIQPVLLPSWGMTMEEGTLTHWHVAEGAVVRAGDELVDIETSKISNTLEAHVAGVLRRRVGQVGSTYRCGALIGVIADPAVPDVAIDDFISAHDISAKAAPPAARTQAVEVGGVRLNILAAGAGKGRPTLLLHGLAGSLGNWALLQSLLAETRYVIAVDLPGHGDSSKHLSHITGFGAVAELLLLLLDELQIPRADLLAHSMGAPIALQMARRAPARVGTLGLIAPAHLGHPVTVTFVRDLIAARSRKQVMELLKQLFFEPQRASREMAEEMLKFRRIDGATEALMKYAEFLANEPSSACRELDGIARPVFVIWGNEDRIIAPVSPESLPRGVELTLIERAGHMPHVEQCTATLNEIVRRLASDQMPASQEQLT